MQQAEKKFFVLLKIALGQSTELWKGATDEEWRLIMNTARKQTLSGVILEGIKLLPKELCPPRKLLLQWFTDVEKIKERNKNINLAATKTAQRFLKDGFRSVILKGQGVAQYYPWPEVRTPGDIDIWLDGTRQDIIQYVRKYCPHVGARYHHIDFPVHKNIPIEVHFTPTWMNALRKNRYLQQLFDTWKDEEMQHQTTLPYCESPVCTPTDRMNRVFLLIHIYHHFFDEGIGLRQLVDYFFLLRKGCTEKEKEEFRNIIKNLGIEKFTKALMYVMHQVMGLDKTYLLLDPQEEDGQFLLREILISGNFGHQDERINRKNGKSPAYYWSKFTHKLHFFRSYPLDIYYNLEFWVWQYLWRKKHGYF